jgi:hypothetical protein
MKKIIKLAVLFLALTFSFCSETESLDTTPEYYDLKYEVLGGSTIWKVRYNSNNGSVEETNVDLPFTKEIRYRTEVDGELNSDGTRSYGFKSLFIFALDATNKMSQVNIYIDGELVDYDQDIVTLSSGTKQLSASFTYRRRTEK